MSHASTWIRQLGCFAPLDAEDLKLLELAAGNARLYSTQDSLAKAGDSSDRMFVVLEGLACEYKMLPDGRRQILAYLFAGDMSDPRQLTLPYWDHSLSALWPSRILTLTTENVQRLESRSNILRAFNRYSLTKHAIAREWLVNVGNRTAMERVSHLLCEIHERMQSVGLSADNTFELPLTQSELADTLALSAVHVNRTLMELRRLKLVTFQNRHARIHDHQGLCGAAGFDHSYLRMAMLAGT